MAFSMLPPELLASAADITLPNLVAAQDQLAKEAREVLPYSFDECTFSKGSIRQSIWSCLDCGEKGVCYGCSISCHSEHRLVELWTKRSFTCDCPTSAMCPPSSSSPSSSSSKRRCNLNPPDQQPQPPNDSNASRYTHNFAGKFCRCGRDYDPETETEAMINCIACEDWLHESCLNLAPRKPERDEPLAEDEEESDSLIPSEEYDGLVCAACARHPFIAERAGTEGWMIIVPSDSEEGWAVKGKKGEEGKDGAAKTMKRAAEDDGPEAKRVKMDSAASPSAAPSSEPKPAETDPPAPSEPAAEPTAAKERKCAGDIFLAHGVRETLKSTLSDDVAASLPFPLVDEEIYEPPADNDEPETLEQVTQRVVADLPRVQAIEALHGYESMKDKLKVMLAAHVASGEAVSRQDIESFFEELRKSKAN